MVFEFLNGRRKKTETRHFHSRERMIVWPEVGRVLYIDPRDITLSSIHTEPDGSPLMTIEFGFEYYPAYEDGLLAVKYVAEGGGRAFKVIRGGNLEGRYVGVVDDKN